MRTKSTLKLELELTWCDQPNAVWRVYGICRRGSSHCPMSGSEFGFAWFWLAMFEMGWPT